MPINRDLPVLRTDASPVSLMHMQDRRQLRLSVLRWAHSYSDNLVEILTLCTLSKHRGPGLSGGTVVCMVEVLYLPQEKPGSLPMPGLHSTLIGSHLILI